MDYTAELDRLIEAPVYVIDFFPEQVPACYGERFWKVEKWFSSKREYRRLYRKFLRILLKLNCCCDFTVSHGLDWEENPSPKRLEKLVESSSHGRKDTLNILVDQSRAMIILTGITSIWAVYDPDLWLRQLLQELAASEGLFFWQPQSDCNA